MPHPIVSGETGNLTTLDTSFFTVPPKTYIGMAEEDGSRTPYVFPSLSSPYWKCYKTLCRIPVISQWLHYCPAVATGDRAS